VARAASADGAQTATSAAYLIHILCASVCTISEVNQKKLVSSSAAWVCNQYVEEPHCITNSKLQLFCTYVYAFIIH